MNATSWGNLPANIIKNIFENTVNHGDDTKACQLVNKHWFHSSISVVYKSVTLEMNKAMNSKRFDSFHSLLKNAKYNIGNHVKDLKMDLTADNLPFLGLTILHCPNIESLRIRPTNELYEYITSDNRNLVLWKNLQRLEWISTDDIDNCCYRLLFLFRNSLLTLKLPSIPNISAIVDEDYHGTEEDLYEYIQEFKSLKSLKLKCNMVNGIYRCEKLLRHCSSNLNELILDFQLPADQPSNTQPLSETQLQIAHQTYSSLKKLVIKNYTPQNALTEFSYIKCKFVNLEELIIICQQFDRHWQAVPKLTIDIITEFIFNIPIFYLRLGTIINLESAQQFFESYMKQTKTRQLRISLQKKNLEGITMQNFSNSLSCGGKKMVKPYMCIDIGLEYLRDAYPPAFQEFNNIIHYIGRHLDTLSYIRPKQQGHGNNKFDVTLMDMILNACPNIQELYVGGCCHNLKRCGEKQVMQHNKLESVRFGKHSKFENGFLKRLSAQLPNLKYMTLDMVKKKNIWKCEIINMPFTKFKELKITLNDKHMPTTTADNSMKEEVIVRLTTKKANGQLLKDIYYHCTTGINEEENNAVATVKSLKLVLGFSAHNGPTIGAPFFRSRVASRIKLHITCFSIEKLELRTKFTKYILQQ